jgi:hypothetical protein
MASALRHQYGFPLDDSYIHQTVARNLARYGVLGFVPGVPSSGATSILWACIQALNHTFGHFDPVIFNLALSWVILSVIGTLLFLLAARDGLLMTEAIAFAVAPACCGNFMWLSLMAWSICCSSASYSAAYSSGSTNADIAVHGWQECLLDCFASRARRQ